MSTIAQFGFLFVISMSAVPLLAGEITCPTSAANSGCPTACCEVTFLQCRPTCEQETVEKSCWDVECKHICVPAIRFPWEKCCEPKCGKIKAVRVLTKRTWECEEPVTKWNVEKMACPPGGYPSGACEPAGEAPGIAPPPPAPPATAANNWFTRLFR